MGDPRIIFLDEPTTGLDPRSRRGLWQIVRDLVADGVTVFLTTQYLEEADRLADHVAVLDGGRLAAQGTPAELKRLSPRRHATLQFADLTALDVASRMLGAAKRDDENLSLQVPHEGGVESLRLLLSDLDRASVHVQSLSVHTPDLDDVFHALTGNPA